MLEDNECFERGGEKDARTNVNVNGRVLKEGGGHTGRYPTSLDRLEDLTQKSTTTWDL